MPLLRFLPFVLLVFARLAFGDLQAEIQQIVAEADLHKGFAGVCIIDTVTGDVLVDIKASQAMIPASNQKLLTTGAAIHVLGSTFTFKTTIVRDGKNLVIVGDGDPTIGDSTLLGISDWSQERSLLSEELQPWVDAVVLAGITQIDTLLIDDRIFDQNFIHPTWPSDQLNNWYCAQVAGINYHLNVVHFFPSPRPGSHASLGLITPKVDWITLHNKTTSRTGKKDRPTFWVARPPNTNKMTARGNVKSTHKEPVRIAFHDPPIVFGHVLASLFRKNGISVIKVARVSESTTVHGILLYTHRTPLQKVLDRSNTDSHNLYAETLLKRIAAFTLKRSGTFDEGAMVVHNAVEQRLGSFQRGLAPADGSGMSRENQVSTETLAKWLASFDLNDPAGIAMLDSLATPGNGTLRNRFKEDHSLGASIHAKSGYILGVCALSGYIIPDQKTWNSNASDHDAHSLSFSIIVNGVKGSVKGAKKMQEAIVFAAINYVNEN